MFVSPFRVVLSVQKHVLLKATGKGQIEFFFGLNKSFIDARLADSMRLLSEVRVTPS